MTDYIDAKVKDSKVASLVVTGNTSLNPGEVYFNSMERTTSQPQLVIVTGSALSSNANLSNIALSKGTLTPTFTEGTVNYTAQLPYETESLTITPTLADANATLKVQGTDVASGTAHYVTLNIGSNAIPVVVTAQDGTKKTYSVSITRAAPSANADLAGLSLNNGVLFPAFSSGVTSYAANVGTSVSSVSVTPTAADNTATVTVNGSPISSVSASAPIALQVGSNTITTVVTAQNGTTRTYTTTVNRSIFPLHTLPFNGTDQYVAVPNTAALEFTAGTIEMWVQPDWAANTKGANPCLISERSSSGTRFSLHMENSLQGIGIWNNSQYLTRPYNFVRGQWYHIAAVIGASSTEFFVNGASIGSVNISMNSFKKGDDLKIGASVTNSNSEYFKGAMDEVRIWNTARTASQIHGNMGTAINPASTGLVAYFPVDEGVTSQANAVTRRLTDYSANALHGTLYNYFLSSNANLSNLTLSAGSLSPAFAANTTSYTTTVGNKVTSLSLTPTVADARATVTVNGTATLSGSAVAIPLNVGSNTAAIAVRAENGTTQTYTLTITRAPNAAPVLTLVSPSLATIHEDHHNHQGYQVASILGSSFYDADQGMQVGMAITGASSEKGNWLYSTDNGTTWTTTGAFSVSAARLLRPQDWVKFLPDGKNGVTATITYKAWDQTVGSAGGTANTSVSGGSSAFSTATDQATLTVTDVNDAPVLSGGPYSFPNIEGNTQSAGKAISAILDAMVYNEVDENDTRGIAVTGTTGSGWQYSADGTTWRNVGTVAPTSALLLSDASFLRYAAGTNGETATIAFRAWDRTIGSPSSNTLRATAGVSSNGGTTAFSTGTAQATITVNESTTVASITRTSLSPSRAASVGYTVTFADPVTGLDVSDFTLATTGLTGAFIESMSGAGAVYTVTVNTGSGDGILRLDFTGITGISPHARTPYTSGDVYSLDKTAPTGTLAINNGAAYTNTAEVALSITATDGTGTGVTGARFLNEGGTPTEWEPVTAGKTWSLPGGDGSKTVSMELKDAAGNVSLVSSTIFYDTTQPGVTVTSNAPASLSGMFSVAINFTESVTGFEQADVTVSNGTLQGFTAVSPRQYVAFVVPSAEGEVAIYVAAHVAQDAATNGNLASTPLTRIYDTTSPSVEVVATAATQVNKAFEVQVNFSEPVNNFTLSDVTVTNGSAGAFAKQDEAHYTLTVTPASTGKVLVYVAANAAEDAAHNSNEASNILTRFYDNVRPEITLHTTAGSPVNAAFELSIEFSEAVTGFSAADLQVTNGTAGDFTAVSDQVYTALITPGANGTVQISVAEHAAEDAATNGNQASNLLTLLYDASQPAVTLNSNAPAALNGDFNVGVSFTEDVTGFTAADVTVANGAVSSFTKTNAREYEVMIAPAADGEVSVSVAANVAADVAKNSNTASNTLTRHYDATKPTLQLASTASSPVNTGFEVHVNFSEPVAGFDLTDVAVANGAASMFTQADAAHYTVFVTPTTDGEVTVSVAASAARDNAANESEAAQPLTIRYDGTRPAVTLTATAANPGNTAIGVTVEFSEAVSGLDAADFTVTNGSATALTKVGETKYTAVISPAADGEVSISMAANIAADAAANGNTASNTITLQYDATAPAGYAIAFNTGRMDVSNAGSMAVAVTGAEPGTTYFYTIESNQGGTPVSGTAAVATEAFTIDAPDLTGLSDGTLTVSLYLVDAAGNKGAAATAQVTKIMRDVAAVATPAALQVPIRTGFANAGLPATVEVTYTTGEKEAVQVNWQEGNYNGLVAGAYTLTGELELKPMTTNLSGHTASITVAVQPNKAPTAIALSNAAFGPGTAPADVIGEFSTADADDPAAPLYQEHVYTLANGEGDTDNSLFEIRGKELHLKSNNGLSGKVDYSIRVRSTDPYQNTFEQVFTLKKTAYQVPKEELRIVNAFSPNGDGVNDNWTIPELRFYNQVHIQVFDRSGVRVFETTDPETGWNGRSTDGQILKGPFLYIVEVRDINWVKRGVVTILSK
nr:Ig-like domain-containing protein [Pontibacter actiniarum]